MLFIVSESNKVDAYTSAMDTPFKQIVAVKVNDAIRSVKILDMAV